MRCDYGSKTICLGRGQQYGVRPETVPDQGGPLRVDKAFCGGGVENGFQLGADVAEISVAAVIGQAWRNHRIAGRSQDMGIEMALGIAGLKRSRRRRVDISGIGEDDDRRRIGAVRVRRSQQPARETCAIRSGVLYRDDISPGDGLQGGIDPQQGLGTLGLMKAEGRRTAPRTPPPEQYGIRRGRAENSVAVLPSGYAGHAKAFSCRQASGPVGQRLTAEPDRIGIVVASVAAVEGPVGQGEPSPDKGGVRAKRRHPVPVQDHQTAAGPHQSFVGALDRDGLLRPCFGDPQPDAGAVRSAGLYDRNYPIPGGVDKRNAVP